MEHRTSPSGLHGGENFISSTSKSNPSAPHDYVYARRRNPLWPRRGKSSGPLMRQRLNVCRICAPSFVGFWVISVVSNDRFCWFIFN